MLIEHVSGHAVLVNSLAIELRGIGDDVRDPAGGSFDRDAAAVPRGSSATRATNLVLGPSVDIGHHGPNFHTELAVDEGVAMLAVAAPRYHAAGLTTVGDPAGHAPRAGRLSRGPPTGRPGPRVSVLPLSNQLDGLWSSGSWGRWATTGCASPG